LIALAKDGRETNDSALRCISAPEYALHQVLVPDFPIGRTYEVALVEYDQSHIVDEVRVVAKCEVDLLGCRNDDVLGTQRILVIARQTSCAIERGDSEA
jgi:hypothetical protein